MKDNIVQTRSSIPIFTNSKFKLREFEENDILRIHQIRSNRNMMRYIGNRAISKLSEAIDYFGYITNYELYGGMAWAIESTDKDIGIIGGIQIFKHNNRNFIAYYLDPSYQKKGIMTNSLKLVIEYYHKNISNDALYANVHIKNTRSESLLRKLGFILNGKLQLENTFSLKSNNNE